MCALFSGLFFSVHTVEAGTLVRPPNNLGLIGYWNFNEGTSTIAGDFSGSGNHGTTSGMASPPTATSGWTEGKFGSALRFDGSNDYVETPTQSIPGPVTASAWVYASNFTQNGFIIGKNPVNAQWELFLEGGLVKWRGGAVENNVICAVPANNQWHHIVGQQTGTTGTLYIDGVQCVTNSATAIGNGAGTIDIGRFSSGYYFNGKIDEVRLYNRLLTPAQVASLYNSGASKFGGSNTLTQGNLNEGLMGHWTFDGGTIDWSKNLLRDVSGKNNTAQMISMPTSTTPAQGVLGQAFKFAGTAQYANASGFPSLTRPVSVGFWRKGLQSPDGSIISTNPYSNFLIYERNSGGVHLAFYDTGGGGGEFQMQNPQFDGNWHHYLFTVDASGNRGIYFDGMATTVTSVVNATNNPNLSALRIGQSGFSNSTTATVDDIRIYNRVLSAAEAQQLFNLAQGKTNASSTMLSQGTTLRDGLVGLWTFDGTDITTSVLDRSGQGNNGYFINGATSSAKAIGKIGQALSFNGSNQYVDVGDANDVTGDFTLSAWINRAGDTLTGGANAGTIIGKEMVSSQQYTLEVQDSDIGGNANKIRFILFGVDITQYSTGTITNDTWYHVVATYNDTTKNKTIYINGVSSGTVTGSGSVAGNSDSFKIGYSQGTGATNNYFNGKIDDVRVYNRTLTADEAKQLYLMGN